MPVYHLTGPAPYFTNCFVLINEGGSGVVVDPAAPPEQIEELLQKHGAKLTHILLTHGHFDHVYSLGALCGAQPCQVYMDPADAGDTPLYPVGLPTLPYAEGGQIRVDELTFTAWHTPGHTPGSWLLGCEDLLFCGDTLFAGSVGRTDLAGGDADAQRASLAKIRALPLAEETRVLPGHGPFSTLGEEKDTNPYLAL